MVPVLGLAALAVSTQRTKVAQDALRRIAPAAHRSQVQDRLLGREIDVPSLGGEDLPRGPGGATRGTLLWILDLDHCAECADDAVDWLQLESLNSYSLALLLLSAPSDELRRRLSTLARTDVRQVRRENIFTHLGPLLPSTKLLLDSMNTVIIVDSRGSPSGCTWGFAAQVKALLGPTQ